MSEFKHDSSVPPRDLDVAGQLKKIQQQLVYLEKKIDILIGQSSGRSSERPFQERRFSKPFRPGGFRQSHQSHDNRGPREDRPRKDFAPGRPFDKPQENRSRGPERGRKAFFRRKMNKFGPGPSHH